MNKFKRKEIAKQIAKLEKIAINSPEASSKVEKEISQIIVENNLNLFDMMAIDIMIQDMLEQ